jgi:hypothetical protein
VRRQAELEGDLVGVVADRTHEDGAEPERLGRDDRVLGGEGGVDEADDRRLEVVRGVASRAFRSGSRTTTTLHGWRFDDVGADCAAATIACR